MTSRVDPRQSKLRKNLKLYIFLSLTIIPEVYFERKAHSFNAYFNLELLKVTFALGTVYFKQFLSFFLFSPFAKCHLVSKINYYDQRTFKRV